MKKKLLLFALFTITISACNLSSEKEKMSSNELDKPVKSLQNALSENIPKKESSDNTVSFLDILEKAKENKEMNDKKQNNEQLHSPVSLENSGILGVKNNNDKQANLLSGNNSHDFLAASGAFDDTSNFKIPGIVLKSEDINRKHIAYYKDKDGNIKHFFDDSTDNVLKLKAFAKNFSNGTLKNEIYLKIKVDGSEYWMTNINNTDFPVTLNSKTLKTAIFKALDGEKMEPLLGTDAKPFFDNKILTGFINLVSIDIDTFKKDFKNYFSGDIEFTLFLKEDNENGKIYSDNIIIHFLDLEDYETRVNDDGSEDIIINNNVILTNVDDVNISFVLNSDITSMVSSNNYGFDSSQRKLYIAKNDQIIIKEFMKGLHFLSYCYGGGTCRNVYIEKESKTTPFVCKEDTDCKTGEKCNEEKQCVIECGDTDCKTGEKCNEEKQCVIECGDKTCEVGEKCENEECKSAQQPQPQPQPQPQQTSEDNFTCGSNVKYDTQEYPTVKIGEQCWFAKNLNIGNMLISFNDKPKKDEIIQKRCLENNNNNCTKFGGLYNWDEMMGYSDKAGSKGICPNGWHIPTDLDWHVLESGLTSTGEKCDASRNDSSCYGAGSALKEGGKSKFELLLNSGMADAESFENKYASLWSSSIYSINNPNQPLNRSVYSSDPTKVYRVYSYGRDRGLSVRCIKD